MARFCTLFSSSSGNSIYVGHAGGGILIDVGVSAKREAEALNCIGVDPGDIGAIFVTHEHTDHVSGVRVFSSRHKTPIYASKGTLEAMAQSGTLDGKVKAQVAANEGTEVCGMFVRPFRTPHDSRESVGYTIEMPDGNRLAIATDIGVITDEIMQNISGCSLVLLESNHDIRMLQCNPKYTYALKCRILSDRGHLSNDACSRAAASLVESGTTRLVLGHLSQENNMPQLAYECTHAALSTHGMNEGEDYLLGVADIATPKMIVI